MFIDQPMGDGNRKSVCAVGSGQIARRIYFPVIIPWIYISFNPFCYDKHMQKYKSYKDKLVVVAGGASGMGEQLVRQIAGYARQVIVLDRNKAAGTSIVATLGNKVSFKVVEMTNTNAVRRTLQQINKKHGPIDYFFNFAGSFLAGEIRDTPVSYWNKIATSNIEPIVNGTTAIYEIMRNNGTGHIINVASSAGLFPVPIMSIYGATKSSIVSLTLGLRMEAKTFNIKASVVCPTIVETPLYDSALYAGLNKAKALNYLKNRAKVQQPEQAAKQILKKVAKNRAIIHTSASTYIGWAAFRVSPALYMHFAVKYIHLYRKTLRLKNK